MSMNKWRHLLIAACISLCATPALASRLMGAGSAAESRPDWVISHIDVRGRTIVINDTAYRLAAAVTVHTAAKKRGSLGDLHSGMRVGYRLKDDGNGQSVISEIWESGGDDTR